MRNPKTYNFNAALGLACKELTTGEVAEALKISLQTVIRWFEKLAKEGTPIGRLIPGSPFRRISVPLLIPHVIAAGNDPSILIGKHLPWVVTWFPNGRPDRVKLVCDEMADASTKWMVNFRQITDLDQFIRELTHLHCLDQCRITVLLDWSRREEAIRVARILRTTFSKEQLRLLIWPSAPLKAKKPPSFIRFAFAGKSHWRMVEQLLDDTWQDGEPKDDGFDD